jgi:hypothetical protein
MPRSSKTANFGDENPQTEQSKQRTRYQMPDPALLIRAVAEEFVTQINAEGPGDGDCDVHRLLLLDFVAAPLRSRFSKSS